jgi:hypothetical protein
MGEGLDPVQWHHVQKEDVMNALEDLYRRWLALFEAARLDEAMELTAPGFEMLAPDGRRLGRDETVALSQKTRAAFQQRGLTRSTEVLSLHVVATAPGHHSIHAQLMLCLTDEQGHVHKSRIGDVLHVGPQGILFNAVTKLADSQSILPPPAAS